MHRSGTSAAARFINILGADLGEDLIEPQQGINVTGFWENKAFVALNERILETLESTWYDVRRLPIHWWRKNKTTAFNSEILKTLDESYKDRGLIAIKDPRLCRLLPLWRETLNQENQSLKCVLVIRNPLEVVNSLVKRDGFSPNTAIYLWLVYVLESEFHSRSLPRIIVTYDDILQNWRNVANDMSRKLHIIWPKPVEDVEEMINREINPELRHHSTLPAGMENTEGHDEIVRTALTVYNKLDAEPLSDIQTYLDDMRSQYLHLNGISGFFIESLNGTNQRLVDKSNQLTELGESHHQALAVIEERDTQISELDNRLQQIGKEHHHALNVLTERDGQLKDLHSQLDKIRSHWAWRVVKRLLVISRCR